MNFKNFTNFRNFILFCFLLVFSGCDKKQDYEPAGTDDIAMDLPYSTSLDMQNVFEAYSTSSNAPWGFAHNGIDFTPRRNLVPFKAVAPGKVVLLQLWKNDKSVNWQVNVEVKYNSLYSVAYTFEPFSDKQSDGQIQRDNIPLSMGQSVAKGQLIGNLYMVGAGSHVHFGLNKNGSAACPDNYFIPVAKDSLLNFIHKIHPTWNLCY